MCKRLSGQPVDVKIVSYEFTLDTLDCEKFQGFFPDSKEPDKRLSSFAYSPIVFSFVEEMEAQ